MLFDFWIEEDTGLPLKVEFHGAPPLGVLHLFDLNALDEMAIVEPADEALAKNRPRVSVVPTAVTVSTADVEPEPETAVVVMPSDDVSVALEMPPGVAEHRPYLEAGPSLMDGWLRHVAPTEGYAVELPEDWEVAQPVGISDRQSVTFASPGGWALDVRRRAQHGALLDVAQHRMESIGEAEDSTVSMTIESLPAGDSVRIERRSDGAIVRVEYIVVRAKLGESGLVYNLVFNRMDDNSTSPFPAPIGEEIMQRFTLLGVESGASIP